MGVISTLTCLVGAHVLILSHFFFNQVFFQKNKQSPFEVAHSSHHVAFPGGSDGKASAYNAGDPGSIPGSGRSGEGNGNPLQYSCLENPMDGGAW